MEQYYLRDINHAIEYSEVDGTVESSETPSMQQINLQKME
jgi:hypothetical protein